MVPFWHWPLWILIPLGVMAGTIIVTAISDTAGDYPWLGWTLLGFLVLAAGLYEAALDIQGREYNAAIGLALLASLPLLWVFNSSYEGRWARRRKVEAGRLRLVLLGLLVVLMAYYFWKR